MYEYLMVYEVPINPTLNIMSALYCIELSVALEIHDRSTFYDGKIEGVQI